LNRLGRSPLPYSLDRAELQFWNAFSVTQSATANRMSTSATNLPASSVKPPSGRWSWLTLAILLALIGLPLAAQYLPAERARWTEARAVEAQLRGELPEAVRLMESAVEASPEDRSLKLRLAEILQEAGQADKSVELCDELLKLTGNPQLVASIGGAGYLSRLYVCKVYSELQRGNYQTSLEFTHKREALSDRSGQSLEGLNSLAYIRGVTGLELDQAVWCIEEIQKRFRRLPDAKLSRPTSLPLQALTAGAMLSRRFQRQGDLLPLINGSLRELEELQPGLERNLILSAAREIFFLAQKQLPDRELAFDERLRLASLQQDRACLLLLRALLREDLGERDASLADRRAARQLGSDEARWLGELLSDSEYLQFAETTSNLLDTEACVRLKLARTDEQRQQVLKLFDLAIAVDEIVQLGWESDLPNQIQLNQDLRAWQRSVARGLAVKLRHRREVLESLGLSDQAASDAERIKQLGFDRQEILF
jgi:hypothetical protein